MSSHLLSKIAANTKIVGIIDWPAIDSLFFQSQKKMYWRRQIEGQKWTKQTRINYIKDLSNGAFHQETEIIN